MTVWTKTLVTAGATAALTAVCAVAQSGMTLADPATFHRALGWLTAVGVLLLAVGIFLRRGGDARFWGITGGAALAGGLLFFLLYGGMEDTSLPGTALAYNLLMLLWTAVPLSGIGRVAVLTAALRDEPRRRRIARLTVALLIAAIIVLIITGVMLNFVNNQE